VHKGWPGQVNNMEGYGDNKSFFVKVCEHRFALP
jgi:hypothetical protein